MCASSDWYDDWCAWFDLVGDSHIKATGVMVGNFEKNP